MKINWDKEAMDCINHGALCTGCGLQEIVKLKNASSRTQYGYLMWVYKLSSKQTLKKLHCKITDINFSFNLNY